MPEYKLLTDERQGIVKVDSKGVKFVFDPTGQATLKWLNTMKRGSTQLAPGECNLYLFPFVSTKSGSFKAEDDELDMLVDFFLYLGNTAVMTTPDSVGAFPIHALLVANTPESIELTAMLFKANPRLMLQTHAPGPFVGEGCLHIGIVNRHEELLCSMLDLATATFGKEELRGFLCTPTVGGFFEDMPMRFYGGTVLAYAVCFDLRAFILKLLDTGMVDLNDTRQCCPITGMLPVHVCVANGLRDVFDFLMEGVPREKRALHTVLVGEGRLVDLDLRDCNALQAAARLGRMRVFKHALRKTQTSVMWKWGPVTQYLVDLSGIDSGGEGANDVMEIVGGVGSTDTTSSFLLDSFMQGFLHSLFEKKWIKYKRLHQAYRLLDVALISTILMLGFGLKANPLAHGPDKPRLVFFILLLIAVHAAIETKWALLFQANQSNSIGIWGKTWQWLVCYKVPIRVVGYILSVIGCVMVLSGWAADINGDHKAPNSLWEDPNTWAGVSSNATALRRALRTRGGNDDDDDVSEIVLAAQQATIRGVAPVVWLIIALGAYALSMGFVDSLLMPFEGLYVFVLSVYRVLSNDLAVFMVLFSIFISVFYFTLYIVYPTAGAVELPQVPAFNELGTAINSMMMLALLGEPVDMDVDPIALAQLGNWQLFNFGVFISFYLGYVLMSLILLLNLLIAMLSHTFSSVREASKLKGRRAFAQCVLRLELAAESVGIDPTVGELVGDKRCVTFRDVEPNAQGESSLQPGEDNGDIFDDKVPHPPWADKLFHSINDLISRVETLDDQVRAGASPGTPRSSVNFDEGSGKADRKNCLPAFNRLGKKRSSKSILE